MGQQNQIIFNADVVSEKKTKGIMPEELTVTQVSENDEIEVHGSIGGLNECRKPIVTGVDSKPRAEGKIKPE